MMTTSRLGSTAWDLLLREQNEVCDIVSSCSGLDGILGGGIPLGVVTQISGAAGVGKTQLCLQLCVNAQIPSSSGGVGGAAIYVDTEGSFRAQRLRQMASAMVAHVNSVRSVRTRASTSTLDVDAVVAKVSYKRCYDYDQLSACVQELLKIVRSTQVKLIVIDSFAFPFRTDFDNFQERQKIMTDVVSTLLNLALDYRLAIVLVNQMTTSFESDLGHTIAALGQSWEHNICNHVQLVRPDPESQIRTAHLLKSSYRPFGVADYQITGDGVRDCD